MLEHRSCRINICGLKFFNFNKSAGSGCSNFGARKIKSVTVSIWNTLYPKAYFHWNNDISPFSLKVKRKNGYTCTTLITKILLFWTLSHKHIVYERIIICSSVNCWKTHTLITTSMSLNGKNIIIFFYYKTAKRNFKVWFFF